MVLFSRHLTSKKAVFHQIVRRMSEFETLRVSKPADYVFNVEINRPEKKNAMNRAFWKELPIAFGELHDNQDCRVVILSAAGTAYTAGIDLMDFAQMFTQVIAAIHGACIGAGVDMTSAADIRVATSDAYFCIKEVDVGLAADVGTLQRFQKVVGNGSLVRQLAYTADKFYAHDAWKMGFLSEVFPDKQSMMSEVLRMANRIAEKSPIAVQTSKLSLNYSRDHSVDEGLNHMVLLNSVMLQSEDLREAAGAAMTKSKPSFGKL